MEYSEVKACLKEVDRADLKELIEEFGEDLVNDYCQDGYGLFTMQEAYQGKFNSDEDFVQDLLESIGVLPENLPGYIHIDWGQTADDVMVDYFEIDGHYFRNM